MLKLTKKADYGLIAVRHLAEHADLGACSAKDLAEMYGIPQEALAKILQRLARSKLLTSQQGTNGGYVLVARSADDLGAGSDSGDRGAAVYYLVQLLHQGLQPAYEVHGAGAAAEGEPHD